MEAPPAPAEIGPSPKRRPGPRRQLWGLGGWVVWWGGGGVGGGGGKWGGGGVGEGGVGVCFFFFLFFFLVVFLFLFFVFFLGTPLAPAQAAATSTPATFVTPHLAVSEHSFPRRTARRLRRPYPASTASPMRTQTMVTGRCCQGWWVPASRCRTPPWSRELARRVDDRVLPQRSGPVLRKSPRGLAFPRRVAGLVRATCPTCGRHGRCWWHRPHGGSPPGGGCGYHTSPAGRSRPSFARTRICPNHGRSRP